MNKIVFQKKLEDDYMMTEAFNSLKTNLAFCGDNNKVIMITSSMPNEGKSLVALRLARALTENGKKTLLLDFDLRKSVIVGKYMIEGVDKGVSHYLSGQSRLEDVIYETETEGFYMAVAGPVAPNPTALLDSELCSQMVAKCREDYDYVIIDAPPLGAVIDAAIIGKYVDGAILVIEQGRISKRIVQDVAKKLKRSNISILGAVLNKIDEHNSAYYGTYYKQYGVGYYTHES